MASSIPPPTDINNPGTPNQAVPGSGFLGVPQGTIHDFQPTAFVDPNARTQQAHKAAQEAAKRADGAAEPPFDLFSTPAGLPPSTNQRTVLAHEAPVGLPPGFVIPDVLPERPKPKT